MRLVPVRKLKEGASLAKPILGGDGRVLLQAGVNLTNAYIRRLQRLGFDYVYIQDAQTYDIRIEESVSFEVQQAVLRKVKTVYDRMSDADQAEQLAQSDTISKEFHSMFKMLFDSLMADHAFIVNLTTIYSSDAYLYSHCMNVGIMAIALGLAQGFDASRVRKFGLGALLHDIGKLQIDRAILDKPGRLTPEERTEIERHCELGYQLLVTQSEISPLSAHCALQHHEKFDGTGYPRQLKGSEIHEFGRLLAVPDVYDALTSNRAYRRALLPHDAIEYLYAQSGFHFDPQFVQLFLKHVNVYPNGLPIQLSNGTAGVVARANPENLQRPVVLILEEHGNPVTAYEIDLSVTFNLTITGCEFPGTTSEPSADNTI